MDWKQKLDSARMNILISNQLRLFGCLIYNFDIIVVDSNLIFEDNISEETKEVAKNSLTAMALIINDKPTIIIYSHFIEEKTSSELIFVILHEIIHILDGHNLRSVGKNNKIHNLAADHIINIALQQDVDKKILENVSIPDDAFMINSLKNKKMTLNEVYEWLLQKTKIKKIGMSLINIDGVNIGKIELEMMTIDIDGKQYQFTNDITSLAETDSDRSKEQEINNTLLAEARAIMSNDSIIGKGDSSGALLQLINKMIEVKIPWWELLKKAITNKIVPSEDNRSWRRMQKRPQALGISLPDYDQEERPAILILCEDQSGSISKTDIKKFANVIYQAIKFFDEIRVIKHDVGIHSDETFKASDCLNEKILFEAHGRGGTSHNLVFKRIEESFEEDDEISLVILLTDFDSDIEKIWSNYKWTKIIPISVCLTKSRTIPKHIDNKPILIEQQK